VHEEQLFIKSVVESTTSHKGANNGKSTLKVDGDGTS